MRLTARVTFAAALACACVLAPVARAETARQQERLPTLAALQQAPGSSPRASLLYATHCMGCHGGDGQGVAGKIPPLNQIVHFMRLPEGRIFLTRVPGASNSSLSDAELADVLNWALIYFSPKASAGTWRPYTAEEVAATRRPSLSEVQATRSALVRELAKSGPAPDERY
ncbi:MAG: cytochrome c [Burkholderiaceae bacterium]|nr:cytochrome c [Burkholderiaceae bacterium]